MHFLTVVHPSLTFLIKKNDIHFSRTVKSSPQFNFSYSTWAAHLPFPFILHVVLTKSCIAPIVPASTLSVCRENILISPHCYLCETAPPSAHNFSKLEPEGLIPELTIQAQKDSKVLFKLANLVLFRTNKRTSRNTWNNAVLFTMVTRTHSATAAGQLIQRNS